MRLFCEDVCAGVQFCVCTSSTIGPRYLRTDITNKCSLCPYGYCCVRASRSFVAVRARLSNSRLPALLPVPSPLQEYMGEVRGLARGVRSIRCRYSQLRRVHTSFAKVLPDADVLPPFPPKRVRVTCCIAVHTLMAAATLHPCCSCVAPCASLAAALHHRCVPDRANYL